MKYDVLIVISWNSKEYNAGEDFNESMPLNDNYIKRISLMLFSAFLRNIFKNPMKLGFLDSNYRCSQKERNI